MNLAFHTRVLLLFSKSKTLSVRIEKVENMVWSKRWKLFIVFWRLSNFLTKSNDRWMEEWWESKGKKTIIFPYFNCFTYTCTCVMCLNILSTIVSSSRSSFYPTQPITQNKSVLFISHTHLFHFFISISYYSSLSGKSISGRYKFEILFIMIKINKQLWTGKTSDVENTIKL